MPCLLQLHLLHLVDLLLLVNGFPRGQLLVVGSRVGQLVFDAPASSLGRGLGLLGCNDFLAAGLLGTGYLLLGRLLRRRGLLLGCPRSPTRCGP